MSDSVWSRALENQELFKKLYKQNESGAEREYQGDANQSYNPKYSPKVDMIDNLKDMFGNAGAISDNDLSMMTGIKLAPNNSPEAIAEKMVIHKYAIVENMCEGLTGKALQACLIRQSQAQDALDSEYYPGD